MATIFPRYLGTGQHVFTGQISIASGGTPLVTNGASENFNISMAAGAWSGGIITGAANGIQVGSTTAHSASLFTNNVSRVLVNSSGNVTVNAPGGGTALVVNQLTGQQGAIVQGTAPSVLISDTGANGAYLQLASSNASGYTINASYSTTTAGSLNIQTAAVTRVAINSTGNVTINSPGSGTALTVNGLNNTTLFQVADGTTTFGMDITAGHILEFGTLTNHGIDLFTNNATRIAIAATGGVAINAPSSGQALAVTGVANQYTAYFTSANTSGQDFGVTIQAGSTAADFALNIVNRANTLQLMALAGDGSGQMGPKLTWAANGSVSIAAPTATTNALILNGAANAYTAQFIASNTVGQSDGLLITAGTNASDTALAVNNQANTVSYLQVLGNGETAIVQQPGASLQNSTTFDVGYIDIPQNLQNVSYATVITDRAKSIDHTSASAHTYTINDASVNYPIGTSISFDNAGSGQVTISVQTTPANLIWCPSGSTGNRILSQYGVATARKVASGAPGTWHLTGVGLS
jgi:hypothetical protein